MFRNFFSKKPFAKKGALTGTPAVRRMKTYAAQSGYVYHYYYDGHREYRSANDHGTEFVFTISPDRKTWHTSSVLVSEVAILAWQASHSRELSATERYAVAKMALFQAFDERSAPAQMKNEIRVRHADVDGIVNTLDL